MSPEQFQHNILNWFDGHGRKDLPWQQDINPYRVWVSEIMLQQTQVVSVIDFFNRFMARFPTLQSLADAPLDDVLHYWSGLGYYARARNLHKTATLIAAAGGEFPQTIEALVGLPGIGRSTAGAILSIACGQSQPILDGNVKRVLARFHAVRGWPGDAKIAARLWQLSELYTPAQRTADYTQAMMDLGATLCTRSKPNCQMCPVAAQCQALAQNLVGQLPESKPAKQLPVKQLYFAILQDQDRQLLLQKRPATGIWGGLWSLLEFESLAQFEDWHQQQGFRVIDSQILPPQRHSFSHYHLDYTPLLVGLENPKNNVMEADHSVWYKAADIKNLGLPAPIKRLLQQLHTEINDGENG